MRKISSKKTFVYKKVFPTIWFGFAGLIFLLGSLLMIFPEDRQEFWPLFLGPLIMMIFGYFLMKQLVFDLVNEAYDEGGTLLFKNAGKDVRIKLTEIKNVNFQQSAPPRVTLSLRIDTELGNNITFMPPSELNPFKTPPIVEELINRIDKARGN